MSATTMPAVEPVIGDGVMDVLERHNAVAEFWDRVALARDCVPEMRRLDVRLVHDPDEEGRVWIDLMATVLAVGAWDECIARQHRFIDESVDRRYPSRLLLSFVLTVEPEPERS